MIAALPLRRLFGKAAVSAKIEAVAAVLKR
jgi:hypothetical protein